MIRILLLFGLLLFNQLFAQLPGRHSHNDYEQPHPFQTAYEHGFESIEADIYLVDQELFVAHDAKDIMENRTLSNLYLDPVSAAIKRNRGTIYKDPNKKLQLLVDIKTEAYSTLDALTRILQNFPGIMSSKNLSLVISGNRPKAQDYKNYPSYIFFDGRPGIQYSAEALEKVALISAGFNQYSKWDGSKALPSTEHEQLVKLVEQARNMGKPFRFWGCPDNPVAWKEFSSMRIGFINTDKIEALSAYMKNMKLNSP